MPKCAECGSFVPCEACAKREARTEAAMTSAGRGYEVPHIAEIERAMQAASVTQLAQRQRKMGMYMAQEFKLLERTAGGTWLKLFRLLGLLPSEKTAKKPQYFSSKKVCYRANTLCCVLAATSIEDRLDEIVTIAFITFAVGIIAIGVVAIILSYRDYRNIQEHERKKKGGGS